MTLSRSRFLCISLALGAAPFVVYARLGMGAQQLTKGTFQDFVQKNGKVLVDFYDPKDPQWSDGQKELETAIRNARVAGSKVPFAKVDVSKESELAQKFVPDGQYPQLMWFLHGEPTQYHRTLRTSKAISDFVLALDRDPMMPVKNDAEARDFNPCVLAEVGRKSALYKTLEIVASKHMDTVAFTFIEGSSSNVITWLGGEADGKKYQGDHTVEAIDRWVRMNTVKSEEIPKDPALLEDEGSKVVVGKNFEDLVMQMDKDVILQVYAPWCGFCKKFAPVWNSFAQTVTAAPNLVVAKMDGTRNSSPMPETFWWDAYPKIFLVRAGEKKPIPFEGQRTVENLVKFVSTQGSKPLNLGKAETRGESIESVMDL